MTTNFSKIWTLLFIVLTIPLYAQNLSHIPGAFINIGVAARPSALGGAYTALVDDANALAWNPAGLARLRTQQLTFSHTKQFNLIPYYYAAHAQNINSAFSHSEAIVLSGDATLQEVVLMFGGSYRFIDLWSELAIGATLKYKNATFGRNAKGGSGAVTGTASGIGLDMGILYELREDITAAVLFRNVIDYVVWNSSSIGRYSQGSPLEIVFGFSLQRFKEFNFTVDFHKSLHRDTSNRLRMGLERSFYDLILLRGGAYQDITGGGEINYSLGTGVRYKGFENTIILFDAAYILLPLGNSLRFSFSFTM